MYDTQVMQGFAADVLRRLEVLAGCSEAAGEITRLFLTPAHLAAVAMVRGWMAQAGLAVVLDASGTLVGSRPGATPDAPVLLLGSHIDTVRNAGRYDGCLGVAVAVAVAARLGGTELPYALEVRAFGDEEGVRFPVTLTGSRAAAGTFDPAWLAVADADGVTLAAAMEGFGLDTRALVGGGCRARRAVAYLEVHIEQGPVLEAAGIPVGVVTSINGAARFEVVVIGQAGHAGTVPMAGRRDALAAAAAMVLAVREVARERDGVVATVGRLTVAPGAPNVIPGQCVFTIDLRAPDDDGRDAAEQALRARLDAIARENDVQVVIHRVHAAPAVACDARLQAHLGGAVAAMGVPVAHLPSGAGHDAMAMAALCPVGMLFVRCAGGISHHPDEAVTESDVAVALDVLERALRTLDPAAFAGSGSDAGHGGTSWRR